MVELARSTSSPSATPGQHLRSATSFSSPHYSQIGAPVPYSEYLSPPNVPARTPFARPTFSRIPPRFPASRLWNPINYALRDFPLHNLPLNDPRPSEAAASPLESRLRSTSRKRRTGQCIADPPPVRPQFQGKDDGETIRSGLSRDTGSLGTGDNPHASARLPPPTARAMPVIAKAAGVEDADEHATTEPHAHDLERGPSVRSQASRASLPQPVARDHYDSGIGGAQRTDGPERQQEDAEGYVWGPSHPCFPHPNPHVPLSSPLAHSTKVIRVQRDWMVAGDLAPQFSNLYPEILAPVLAEEEFRGTIKRINAELLEAFSPYTVRAWVDALLGVVTLWVWEDLGLTGVKIRLRRLERWFEAWNAGTGFREGVRLVPLRRTGYMSLDIQIPDPHVSYHANASRPQTQHSQMQGDHSSRRLQDQAQSFYAPVDAASDRPDQETVPQRSMAVEA